MDVNALAVEDSKTVQDAQPLQRDGAAGCVIFLA